MGEVRQMTEAIGKVLAGHAAAKQGAALADCLAMWLAGHHVPGDPDATRALRDELLAAHLAALKELIPINAAHLGTPR